MELHIYDRLGVKKYINAHDTYTIYGGSRMAGNTLEAINMAAEYFVDINGLQNNLGDRIAAMTKNEAAYITNGASGALLLAVCACMTRGDMYRFRRLPETDSLKNEIIVMRCQRNAYDAALSAAGAVIVEIGDADETPDYELEGAINDKTAAVFYFESRMFARASMPLEKVIEIARGRGIPVVVDAAAQLPPAANLWKFTQMGADMALFSGGKTLCGPQASGLLVGKAYWIDICRKLGAPVHGVCRSSKVGREEMIGLYVALENYLSLNHEANRERLENIVSRLMAAMERTGAFTAERLAYGPVGQDYPRALGRITAGFSANALADMMKDEEPGIFIGSSTDSICISPLNLTDHEAEIVIAALERCVKKLI